MRVAVVVFFAAFFSLFSRAAISPLPPLGLGIKPFGVLVLGEGEAPQWTETAKEIKVAFAARFPVEFAFGLADKNSLQKGIDQLEARGVKKIVVVPLFLSSSMDVMKQVRYLLGIGKNPSAGLFKTYQTLGGPPAERLAIRVPVALMPTLDFSPIFFQILVKHAEAGNMNWKDETLVIVSESSKDARSWKSELEDLAGKARQAAGFKASSVFLLNEGVSQTDAEESESFFKTGVRRLRLKGPVRVISVELAPDLVMVRLSKMIPGLLVSYNDQSLLPNPLILSWIEEAAQSGAKLGDMRRFKDKKKSVFVNFPRMEIK
jgi:hypothetical protein